MTPSPKPVRLTRRGTLAAWAAVTLLAVLLVIL